MAQKFNRRNVVTEPVADEIYVDGDEYEVVYGGLGTDLDDQVEITESQQYPIEEEIE